MTVAQLCFKLKSDYEIINTTLKLAQPISYGLTLFTLAAFDRMKFDICGLFYGLLRCLVEVASSVQFVASRLLSSRWLLSSALWTLQQWSGWCRG